MPKGTRSASASSATTHIALLRGINVGGKHLLPMAALKALFEKGGCSEVRTYIQSGNVAFAAATSDVEGIGEVVAARIAKKFGFQPSIVLRSGKDFARIIAGNPFLKGDMDHKTLHVGFLAGPPAAKQIALLDPKRSPGDRFEVRGREIFLHTPNGAADSRLTNAYFDSILKLPSTFRNWRTVMKLAEMAAAPSGE